MQKEEKATPRMQRGGRRSRSNTREPNKRPPLIATVSDPAIITTTNSLLLTQLLTNSELNLTKLLQFIPIIELNFQNYSSKRICSRFR